MRESTLAGRARTSGLEQRHERLAKLAPENRAES